MENRKKRPPMQTVLDCLEYLYKHPSSAVALQIMYDEHNKVKNLQQQQQQQTLQPSPQPVAAGAGPGISSVMIPAVLDSASKDVSQRSATSTAPNTALGSSTSSSASTVSHSTSEMTNSTLGEDEMSRALTSRVQVMDRSLIKPLHKYLPNPVVEQSIPNLPLLGGQSSSSSAMIPTVLKDSSSSNGHADMSGIPDLSLINLSEATQALSQSLAAAMPALPELPSTQDSQKTEERLRQIDYAAETAAMFDPLGK